MGKTFFVYEEGPGNKEIKFGNVGKLSFQVTHPDWNVSQGLGEPPLTYKGYSRTLTSTLIPIYFHIFMILMNHLLTQMNGNLATLLIQVYRIMLLSMNEHPLYSGEPLIILQLLTIQIIQKTYSILHMMTRMMCPNF